MADDVDDREVSLVRAAIQRFNDGKRSEPAERGSPEAMGHFVVDRVAHVDGRVLVVGKLTRDGGEATTPGTPMALAWAFGADGEPVDIRFFADEQEARGALELEA